MGLPSLCDTTVHFRRSDLSSVGMTGGSLEGQSGLLPAHFVCELSFINKRYHCTQEKSQPEVDSGCMDSPHTGQLGWHRGLRETVRPIHGRPCSRRKHSHSHSHLIAPRCREQTLINSIKDRANAGLPTPCPKGLKIFISRFVYIRYESIPYDDNHVQAFR